LSTLPSNLDDTGFTPGRRHFAELLSELALADPERAERAARALSRAALAAAPHALSALAGAGPPLRARLLKLIGRAAALEPSDELSRVLLAELGGMDPKARRTAIVALGKCGGPGVERALLDAWDSSTLPQRRSLTEALGKVGGATARDFLDALASDDAELERLRRRALAMLDRSLGRDEASAIATEVPLGVEQSVVIRTRRGLASVLCDEAEEHGFSARTRGGAECVARWAGPLAPLLALRTATELGVEIPLPARGAIEERVVSALLSDAALCVLSAWSHGRPRFRASFAGGGRRRAPVWRIATRLAEHRDAPVNDPRAAPWTVEIDEPRARVVLIPKGAPDVRFSYRVCDVRAASHPTVAAALARVAKVRDSDVVWDPFVGSGLELVERARLGPYRRLIGSDIDPRALAAARQNLDAAGVGAELVHADATSHSPGPVTLVITNPPMGRRVARDGTLPALLDAFSNNVARVLAPGGRLVWLAPLGSRSAQALAERGLRVEQRGAVDLGGFDAELMLAHRY
jgi:SAM-dependent methyltransferase